MKSKKTSLALARRSSHRIAVPLPPEKIGGMSAAQFARFRAIGNDPRIDYASTLSSIFAETERRVQEVGRQAREGKSVLEASLFLRWLQFSGIIHLLERHALPDQDFTPLRKLVEATISECGEQLSGQRIVPKYNESDIAKIDRKLDILLGENARPVSSGQVELIVISGGLDK